MSTAKNIAGGALVGLAVGYVAGILTAPDSGKNTRNKIEKTANDTINEIEKQFKSLYKQSQDLIDKVLAENPKVSKALDSAIEGVKDSQKKIKQIISSIKGDENINQDLNEAIKEAKLAIAHLSDFATKNAE